MRPNRIGIWPLALNSIPSGAVVDMNRYDTTNAASNFLVLNSNRTPYNVLEILGGENGGDIFDTVYSRWHCYAGEGSSPLRIEIYSGPQDNHNVRFTIGGFVRAPALQSVAVQPQPIYVRMVGWASCVGDSSGSNPGATVLTLQPVIGIKQEDNAPTVGSNTAAKESRRCSYATALPVKHTQLHTLTNARHLYYAQVDETFALSSTFTRTGGRGFSSAATFGVGWSFYNMFHNVQGTPGRIYLEPEINAFMSVWFYTADFDMFDPNKS